MTPSLTADNVLSRVNYMKRVFAFFVAVVLILPLCGCSGGEPLTKQEYADEIYYRVSYYCRFTSELGFADYEYKTNGKAVDLEKFRKQAEYSETLIKGIKHLVPPAEYKKYHNEFCDGIKYHTAFYSELDKALNAESMEEFDKALQQAYQNDECTIMSTFSDFIQVTVKDGLEYDDI